MTKRPWLISYPVLLILAFVVCGGAGAARSQDNKKEIKEGAEVYLQARCFACHGNFGTGTLGPALSGNVLLTDKDFVITMILLGRLEMPAFAHKLSNDQIAAVVDYIRNSWGNSFGTVTPQDVANLRQRLREAYEKTGATQKQQHYPER